VAIGTISLTVGEVTTSIEVQAEAARVETENSDRGQLINEATIESLPLIGRDYLGVLQTLPGNAVTGGRDNPGWGGGGAPIVNGGNTGQFLVTLDGIASQDSGAPNNQYIAPNVDAIGEVKVVTSNYNAEYGARSAGQMNVTMKSGTADFHGSLYHYWRHEQFNANAWFNNRNSTQKSRYRYQNPGGTIGGPVIIPGTSFNESRTKMFFFFSEEHLLFKNVGNVDRVNQPTAAERIGDFSQSLTDDGIPLSTIIKDPTTGNLFPNGVIPQDRTTPMGRAIMALFPDAQGKVDPSGNRQYNSEYQWITDRKRIDRILRLDFNLGASTTSYLRLMRGYENRQGYSGGFLYCTPVWGQCAAYYQIPTQAASFTVIHTLTPTLINETTVGVNRAHQSTGALYPDEFAATNTLPTFKDPVTGQAVSTPKIFGADARNLIPNINFTADGAQSPGEALYGEDTLNFGFTNRWPFEGTDQIGSVINNLSWIKGDHNVKFGFYLERMARNVSVYAQYDVAGTYWFGTDSGNPLDTGWPMSNALVGTVQSYGEDNIKQINRARYTQVEWFAQDSWAVSQKLSVDIGMRFQVMQPTYSAGATLGFFDRDAYNAAATGQLLFPACSNGSSNCSSNKSLQVARNLVTGAEYPYPRRGLFDPASYTTLPWSGIVQYDSKYFNTPGVLLSPRLGFAYDVFGDGNTAIRAGFGIFYDRPYSVDNIGATGSGVGPMAAPPNFQAPRFYNTTFTELRNAQPWYAPQRVVGGDRDFKSPTVYSWSFGVQQNVGWGTILDVAYVGNRSAHQFTSGVTDFGALPLGLTWSPTGLTWSETTGPDGRGTPNPNLLDPTNPSGLLATDLIRALVAYNGYRDIDYWDNRGGDGNYHSLQIQVNRQFGNDIQFGANYTWSRTLQYTPRTLITNDRLLYGLDDGGPRNHVVNMNFNWGVPGTSSVISNKFVNAVTENWRLSGIVQMYNGRPMGVTCEVQSPPIGYPAGTPSAAGTSTSDMPLRCAQVGSAFLPAGSPPTANSGVDSRLYVPINVAAFQLPQPETLGFGNAPQSIGYGPGFFNLDMSIEKVFPIREQVSLTFRADTFNFLNHFNPDRPELRIRYRYNASGAETQTRSGIGGITSAQNAERRMAVSARLRF